MTTGDIPSTVEELFYKYCDDPRTLEIGFYDAWNKWYTKYNPKHPCEHYSYDDAQLPITEYFIRYKLPENLYDEMLLSRLAYQNFPVDLPVD